MKITTNKRILWVLAAAVALCIISAAGIYMFLAKISCEKREQEMEELREKKVRVHGNFNGKLLADLLQEDLMEIPEDEKAA